MNKNAHKFQSLIIHELIAMFLAIGIIEKYTIMNIKIQSLNPVASSVSPTNLRDLALDLSAPDFLARKKAGNKMKSMRSGKLFPMRMNDTCSICVVYSLST